MWIRRAIATTGLALMLLTACGGEPELNLSPEATTGRQIANQSGCASCHGRNGQGVTAPSWHGLYLNERELDGGTTVVADDDYLYQSITEPRSQNVRGWTIKMPENDLGDDEVRAIISYIKELQQL